MKLQDKVALIFGGSSGIGEAVAMRFAAEEQQGLADAFDEVFARRTRGRLAA